MSWLSNIVNNAAGWGGEDPNAILQRQQAAAAAAAAAEQERQRLATLDASVGQAGTTSATSQGVNKGPTALPEGFENSLLPSSFADLFIDASMASGRSKADDFISNMLARGTTTATGADAARAALTAQDPGVRQQISTISNSLLDQERAKLRGYGPAGDIAPAQAEASAFQGGFGGALQGAPCRAIQHLRTRRGCGRSNYPGTCRSIHMRSRVDNLKRRVVVHLGLPRRSAPRLYSKRASCLGSVNSFIQARRRRLRHTRRHRRTTQHRRRCTSTT
jgi:hypothetical protein